ncbi:MAG: ribosome silencing factor [Planctomycetes bacterium]|nr:ribosome silencing factor [Planctomycetota bacterium]
MSETQHNSEALAIRLAQMAHDHRCEQIVVLDLRGVSPITDFFVVCTGSSDRQMRTTGEEMMVVCKKEGDPAYGHSGLDTATWVLVDFVNVAGASRVLRS